MKLYYPADILRSIADLNSADSGKRAAAASSIGKAIRQGTVSRTATDEVNNHVHTTCSFSPYEPAMAAFRAWEAGLQIVGSMDHDSIAAAGEMLQVGKDFGIATTVGFEVRCSFLSTPLRDRKINNPDSAGIAYMCVHGVPENRIGECADFLAPLVAQRNRRNRAEVEALNALLAPYGLSPINFEQDVVPLSRCVNDREGSITERHILSAFAGKIIHEIGRGAAAVAFLEERLSLVLPVKIRGYLLDTENPHYRYDLIGVLKSGFLGKFFIQPSRRETLEAEEVTAFAGRIGAIAAYAYLGDVTESPTGDKRAEQFEDAFLDKLFPLLKELGFSAVTYMPPRNTREQLLRVQELSERYELMQISGVDINSSRQQFNCPQLLQPEFRHLVDSAWALVAHEKLAVIDPSFALFHGDNPYRDRTLRERIAMYAEIGRDMDPRQGRVNMEALARKFKRFGK